MAYHKSLRSAESAHQRMEVENLLSSSASSRMAGLYKRARKPAANSEIPVSKFLLHCQELFSSPSKTEMEEVQGCLEEHHPRLQPFTESEMDEAFKKMKSKAPSTSGVSPFQIALLRTQIQPLIQDLFSYALHSSFFPPGWMESAIIFIHKKGPKDIPDNHRTIALENLFLKMMSTLLAAHFSGLAEVWNLLPEFQFGFRRSRSTTTAATLLYEIVHANISTKRRVYRCFVDFSKAFDRVDRTRLFLKLQLWGIPRSICVLLANIYRECELNISV